MTIIEQDDECVSEYFKVVVDFADILLQVARREDVSIASKLVDSLTDELFEKHVLKRYLKGLSYCKSSFNRKRKELMTKKGLH